MNALIESWKKWISVGLDEDCASFDWTARAAKAARAGSEDSEIEAKLIAKAEGIWACASGLRALEILSAERGMDLRITREVKDGDAVTPGQTLCTWNGSPEAIVTFERTFINLASYASGIATATSKYVSKARAKGLKTPPRITATRKTLPGYRDLAIESTLIGGAHPHRFNWSGGLLLKETHIAASGGIAGAVKNAREVIPHLLKIEIEVTSIEELKEAISAGAEVIMLDNFSPELVKEAIALKPSAGILYEVSGGITLETLDRYLIEGIDVISVGSLTHSVKALDLSLLVTS
jgi:nicotinate-nucleotide pyrophosphorylase (carboxylating)